MIRCLLILVLMPTPVAAQEHEHRTAAAERLGTVSFQTSCSAAARPSFNRAVALLHSFDFPRAVDGFKATTKADPSCAMAHWGIAISRWGNPFAAGLKAASQLRLGREAIAAARTPAARTERERGYVEAAAHLYTDYEHVPQGERVKAYRDAMSALSARYPSDDEAAIFYALALAFSADPADKTFDSQLKAGAILEKLFAKHRDHPGLAHYIIHTYDVPPLANRGLEAARRYASIAPAAPHALHMPSHTFTRVGYWQESIETNIAAARSAKREGATAEELHATDYQAYAYLQTGRDAAAKRLVDALPEIAGRFDPTMVGGTAPPAAGFFALAAIPARYALERGAWSEAVALIPTKTSFPFTDAMTHFARALGAVHLQQTAVIGESVDALQRIRDRLRQSHEDYWAEQVDIQRQIASAWLVHAEGRTSEAIAQMRTSAEREDATEKNAMTPGPLAPARELLGEMLLAHGDAAPALTEFEATMKKEPNRFRAVAGAAKAAAAAGQRTRAAAYYAQLLKICAKADADARPELADARSFLR